MISKRQYVALSEFRARLGAFLRFSEEVCRAAGLRPAHYLLLLHLRGFPGRDWATIGELAERSQHSHQATVALVKRCEARGLLRKRRSATDARRVELHATAAARRLVERVALRHRGELQRLRALIPDVAAAGRRHG